MIEMFAGDYLDNAAQTVAKLLKKVKRCIDILNFEEVTYEKVL